jgi:hypothetical protein
MTRTTGIPGRSRPGYKVPRSARPLRRIIGSSVGRLRLAGRWYPAAARTPDTPHRSAPRTVGTPLPLSLSAIAW